MTLEERLGPLEPRLLIGTKIRAVLLTVGEEPPGAKSACRGLLEGEVRDFVLEEF